jgi:pimeloyl-ACP methyl ester carboxylesterase
MNDVNGESYIPTEDGVRLFFQQIGSGPKIVIPNGIYLLDDFKSLAEDHTLIVYDLRNRGLSDRAEGGDIRRDVDDLEAVRRHFGIDRVDLIGHSYIGLMVALYAMKYPANVNRVVQIGPMEPIPGKQYPAHLTNNDGLLPVVFGKLAQLQKDRQSEDDVEFCRKAWSVLGAIYVANPADEGRINWGRCELANERNFMKHWTEKILPSIQSLRIAESVSNVKTPVLTIHGTKDRNAPYGGGREWALILPDARLVTVEDAAHAPWIEAPEKVLGAVRTFFDGRWPEGAEKVASLS